MRPLFLVFLTTALGAALSGCHAREQPAANDWSDEGGISARIIRDELPGAGPGAYVVIGLSRTGTMSQQQVNIDKIAIEHADGAWEAKPRAENPANPDRWTARDAPLWPDDAQVDVTVWLVYRSDVSVRQVS